MEFAHQWGYTITNNNVSQFIYMTFHSREIHTQRINFITPSPYLWNSTLKSNILKTVTKLKILRDNFVDCIVIHILNIKNMNSVQHFSRNIIFNNSYEFFIFFIFSLSLIHLRCCTLRTVFSVLLRT